MCDKLANYDQVINDPAGSTSSPISFGVPTGTGELASTNSAKFQDCINTLDTDRPKELLEIACTWCHGLLQV
jgi:hypothetical protein